MQKYAKILNDISAKQELLLNVNGETLALPIRVLMAGEYVVIDAINYVCDIAAFESFESLELGVTNSELLALDLYDESYEQILSSIAQSIQFHLHEIFGDDYSLFPMIAGIHHYQKGYYIKSNIGEVLGTVGIGGQNNTVFVGITGSGCKLASGGFEKRLYHFLANAPKARITRIDLAHDDIKGNYSSFEIANQKESELGFMLPKARNRPAVTIHGEFKHNDPSNKGLTLNVGSRKNGKVIRCYEKGKQLGDKQSVWFRSELEIHNKARLIPFDVLLSPTEFFAGAYPYCLELIELAKKHKGDSKPQDLQKMSSIKKEAKITVNKAINIIRHQFGMYIKAFSEIFVKKDGTPDHTAIINKIMTDKKQDYYPKRLKAAMHYVLPKKPKVNKNPASTVDKLGDNDPFHDLIKEVMSYDDTNRYVAWCQTLQR